MRLAVEMAVMEMDGEWNAVAVGTDSTRFHGMLRLNETAAEIIKLLAEDTTVSRIEKALGEKYTDSAPEEISRDVSGFISRLRAEGLLTE